MKKVLLALCVGLCLCACSKKESKPAVDLETDNTSPANVLSNMMDAANKAVEGIDTEKPYYFSEGLKNAVANCTPYSEDVYEKNPAMKQGASALLSMFSDKLDASSIKFMFDVKGKQGDNPLFIPKYSGFGHHASSLQTAFFANFVKLAPTALFCLRQRQICGHSGDIYSPLKGIHPFMRVDF